MPGFLIALGIIVLLVLIAAGYRRWRPASTGEADTYRDLRAEAQHRPDTWPLGGSGAGGGG